MSQSGPIIVAMSVCVSILASFTALNLSGRLVAAEHGGRRWWIISAAVALGGGTWAMHFLGMLSMPMPATYDVRLTIVSLVLPILASRRGFEIISNGGLHRNSLAAAGLLVGSGIVAMHYIGMAAMRTPGMIARYEPALVAASVMIALAAATAALWLAFRTHDTRQRLVASIMMGIAISGMHYTAMAGVTFVGTDRPIDMDPVMAPASLALAVTGVASFLLILGLVTAYFHRRLATVNAREAAALKASEERYRALIESTSDMIGLVDRDGVFTYENSSALRVLGYGEKDLIGHHPSEFVASDAVADTLQLFKACLERPGLPTTAELCLLHKDGTRHEFEVVATNFLHVPAIHGVVLNLRDITERKEMVARLEMLSETDLLTEALNRRGFARMAAREFERARRRTERLAIIMLDLDHFKAINDRFGHAAGDLVLASVAGCCRAQIRESDLLGRLGGEEFAILLTDGHVDAAHMVMTRLRKAIAAARISSIKGDVSVTASFGIATVDPASEELDSALARADTALYEAKNAGRNCIRISA
jgi:diguanylate cyclase (GGDEF)-like protein/PAS domain S-box-containing protein